MTPNPLTLASINLQGISRRSSRDYQMAGCGCLIPDNPDDWYTLCQYHEGFEDGVEAATIDQGETT